MEGFIDEIQTKSGVIVKNDFQPKHEEEKTKENNLDVGADENSLLIIKELKNLDQNKVEICLKILFTKKTKYFSLQFL